MGLCSSSETFHESTNSAQGGLRAESGGGGGGAAAAAMMMGGNHLSSRVELFISCKNIRNLDRHSKSDCFCVLEEMNNGTKQWSEIGRSEIVQNSLNPEFVTRFKYIYKFEESQKIRVKIYDADNDAADTKRLNLANQDFAGETPTVYLGDIVSAANHPAGGKEVRLQGRTKHGNATGTCMIRCEEMANQNGVVTLQFKGRKLANKDGWTGKSDPFLRMSRTREIGKPLPMFRSEVVMNNLSPNWRQIQVSLSALCNGDPYRSIEFEVADYDEDGSHDMIGKCSCSLNDLLQFNCSGSNPKELPLKDPKTGKNSGTLVCTHASFQAEPSFLDYIMGGTEVNFMVAIDFTASNRGGNQDLHFISQYPNEYQQAIQRVGDVLEFYDNDKLFPTWGFGGVVQPGGRAEHCFNLVAGGPNAAAPGVQGIMNAYNEAVQKVQLSGPTIFSEVLRTACGIAQNGMDGSQYFVLLILTDGEITDMDNTINNIIQACHLPISILIVGVGTCDFHKMELLDGDNGKLTSPDGRTKASRDIVQFVPFRDFKDKSHESFSSELLAEIPYQLTSFMKSRNIKPRPRVQMAQPVVPIAVATEGVKVDVNGSGSVMVNK
jgi:hypothetical protein